MKDSLRRLRNGETYNLLGILLQKDGEGCWGDEDLQPGDLYIAENNTGPKLLTVKRVDRESGVVFPTTMDYSFNLRSCVKVKAVE